MKTIEQVIREEEAARREWEENTYDGGFKIADLRRAFERVQDKAHWKNPVKATVAPTDLDVTYHAVIFYQGSVPTVHNLPSGRIEIRSRGYICN